MVTVGNKKRRAVRSTDLLSCQAVYLMLYRSNLALSALCFLLHVGVSLFILYGHFVFMI